MSRTVNSDASNSRGFICGDRTLHKPRSNLEAEKCASAVFLHHPSSVTPHNYRSHLSRDAHAQMPSNSLVHVSRRDLSAVLNRLTNALKPSGFCYMSFKHGDSERIEGGDRKSVV